MQNVQKINFKQERNFEKVFADTLKFIKQNFKPFFGSIILIAGPFLLIGGFALGYTQAEVQNLTRNITRLGSFNYMELLSSLGISFFFRYVGEVVLISVTYNFMILYNEKPEGEPITIQEVGKRVISNFWSLFGSMFTLLIVVLSACVILGFIFFGLGYALGVFGGILIALILIFGILLWGPVIFYQLTAGFYVCLRDGVFIFDALGKVKKYLRDNYWWTWLIMVVAGIGIGIVSAVFTLPASVVAMGDQFSRMQNFADTSGGGNSTLLIVLYTVATFMTSIISVVYLVLCAFNYSGHEEKQEGAGLFSRIDEIK